MHVAAGCLIGKCCWNIKRAEDNVPHPRKEPHVCIGVDLKLSEMFKPTGLHLGIPKGRNESVVGRGRKRR